MQKISELLYEALSIENVNKTPGKKEVVILIGRLQPPTKMHLKIIDDAVKKTGMLGVIGIVKSDNKKSPIPSKLITKMIKTARPKIEILQLTSGFIGDFISMLRDKNKEPKILLAGTDRVKSYKGQLKRYTDPFNLKLKVEEIKRTDEDISASAVRKAIAENDIKTFKSMMDPKLYSFFDELKKYIKE